jgi:hypothetical protein
MNMLESIDEAAKSFFLPRPGNYLTFPILRQHRMKSSYGGGGGISPRRAIKFLVFLADITLREHMANVTGTMKRGRPSGRK